MMRAELQAKFHRGAALALLVSLAEVWLSVLVGCSIATNPVVPGNQRNVFVPIAIVVVGPEDLQGHIDDIPAVRRYYSKVLRALRSYQPLVTCVDRFFQAETDADQLLREELISASNAMVEVWTGEEGQYADSDWALFPDGAASDLSNLKILLPAATFLDPAIGLVQSTIHEVDGAFEGVSLAQRSGPDLIPSYALRVLSLWKKSPMVGVADEVRVGSVRIRVTPQGLFPMQVSEVGTAYDVYRARQIIDGTLAKEALFGTVVLLSYRNEQLDYRYLAAGHLHWADELIADSINSALLAAANKTSLVPER